METLACLSTNNCYQSDAVKRSLLLPAAVDMGFRAILEILKTDDFEEFKEEMGLKASILKGMVQSTIIEMGYINFSYRGTRQLIYFFYFRQIGKPPVPVIVWLSQPPASPITNMLAAIKQININRMTQVTRTIGRLHHQIV